MLEIIPGILNLGMGCGLVSVGPSLARTCRTADTRTPVFCVMFVQTSRHVHNNTECCDLSVAWKRAGHLDLGYAVAGWFVLVRLGW